MNARTYGEEWHGYDCAPRPSFCAEKAPPVTDEGGEQEHKSTTTST